MTAVPTLAACPRWTSSDGSPARTCSKHHKIEKKKVRVQPKRKIHLSTCAFHLVERSQVVPGLDEEGLVDPWVVHVVSCRSHEAQEHVQRAQLLRQLQHTYSEETSLGFRKAFQHFWHPSRYILPLFRVHTYMIYLTSI